MQSRKDACEKGGETSSNVLPHYNTYEMPIGETLFYALKACMIILTISYIFYHSIILSILLCPLGAFYPAIKTSDIIRKRKNELNLQFRDMLYSISSSLSAGKSIEMAFRDVQRDLAIMYPDPDTDIIREVQFIIRKIEMNETIESALSDFAWRADIDDICNFVDVFQTCKRTGGNIVEVVRNASNIINDKIEIKQEIDMLLAERKFEQKILNILPILMILLLSSSAGDYIDPVFNTLPGRVAMTVSVVLLAAGYFISKKIMDINV